MSDNDEDRGKIRRLSAENQGMIKHKSGYLVAERSGGSGDTVCDPYRIRGGDVKHGFPGLALKLVATVW
jgi:hypothetical protein